ncbi:MAG: phytanoyl-CoA dioxygenase family protein [Acidobacteria bacterium]|nr:phytanoyl-CoA dioxygenase family protein [Acidobacteriota bacterium]MBI3424759.1 phytanoyl-CoA dioxygenase family protein [Acidobacteriota bacterium]
MTATQFSFDDEPGLHAPDLYDYAALAEGIDGLDAIDDVQVARYHAQGVIAVHNAFTAQQVQDALDGLTDLIAGKVPEFTNIQFRGDVRDRLDQLTVEERINAVRRLLYFAEYDARLLAIAQHPALLAAVEKLLNAPPVLFQSMALVKPPRGREKPWHQDHAYFELPLDARVVGVWIALDEAGIENSCMRFLPGWHRQIGSQGSEEASAPREVITSDGLRPLWPHYLLRDLQICDREMAGPKAHRIAAPLQPGGLVLFDSYIPHGTPSNLTAQRRRALQFHYTVAEVPKITAEERVALWLGEDGSC